MVNLAVMLSEEPPLPTPEEHAMIGLSPALYIAIILVAAGIIAWKYKFLSEFLVIVCSTIAAFIIGFIAIPHYPSVGLAMASSAAGLLLSSAAVVYIRLIKPKKPQQ